MRALLTLNAGSSSLKFSIYTAATEPRRLASGQVEPLGGDEPALTLRRDGSATRHPVSAADHAAAVDAILATIAETFPEARMEGVGHRIVHGGADFSAPVRLDDAALARLARLEPMAPLHQPHNLAGVRAARAAFPDAVQIGCFDTAFHRGHPWVNDTFALPRKYYDRGVRRYGFHGLSYAYIAGRLAELDPAGGGGRAVVAHLGNGASICALREGRSVGSTMGFSALDGLPMGTRCGQIDPGVLLWLMAEEGMGADAMTRLLYHDSGLKGLSGISGDMRTLLASDAPEAASALDYYVFRIRRELGAMAAVLGGLDTLVFCGGVGENASPIRARVCADMAWLGIVLDPVANTAGRGVISTGPVTVRVVPTDEERMIARAVSAALD